MCTLVALDLALTNIAVALLAVAIQQCIVATNPAFTVTIESIVRWVSELVRQEGRKEGRKVSRPRRLRHATHHRDAPNCLLICLPTCVLGQAQARPPHDLPRHRLPLHGPRRGPDRRTR